MGLSSRMPFNDILNYTAGISTEFPLLLPAKTTELKPPKCTETLTILVQLFTQRSVVFRNNNLMRVRGMDHNILKTPLRLLPVASLNG
jgi:hypothetical protein